MVKIIILCIKCKVKQILFDILLFRMNFTPKLIIFIMDFYILYAVVRPMLVYENVTKCLVSYKIL